MNTQPILDAQQINHKIRRIAYQIYETFSSDTEVVIAGICGNGYVFAEELSKMITEISPIKATLCEITIDKKNPMNPISTSIDAAQYQDKSVVIVDDVLHTGTTLVYGVKHFLDKPLKKLKTAVLVDRNHKKYPIKADFKGLSLSTSLQEHVNVVFDKDNTAVYLS